MTAQDLSPDEAIKVAAFGLDDPTTYGADLAVALMDRYVAQRPNPMNGDGSNYAVGEVRKQLVRLFPTADARADIEGEGD